MSHLPEFTRDFFLDTSLERAVLMKDTDRNLGFSRFRHLYFLGKVKEGVIPKIIDYELTRPPINQSVIRGRQTLVKLLMDLDTDSFAQIERAVADIPRAVSIQTEIDQRTALLIAGMKGREYYHILQQITTHLPRTASYNLFHQAISDLEERIGLSAVIHRWDELRSSPIPVFVNLTGSTLFYDDKLVGRRDLPLNTDLIRVFDVPYQERLLAITPDINFFLNGVYPVLSFYVSLAKFGRSLKKVIVGEESMDLCCFPEIADERGCANVGCFYNPLMSLPEHINEFNIDKNTDGAVLSYKTGTYSHDYWSSEKGIHVVLGRNKGSKSTYIVGRGVLQLMAQIGSPIPAKSAVISPVSAVGSVFLTQVHIGAGQSTFSDALDKFGGCLDVVTKHDGLILLDDATEGTDVENSRDYMDFVLNQLVSVGAQAYLATQQQRLWREQPRFCAAYYTTVPQTYEIKQLVEDAMPEQVSWKEIAFETALSKHLERTAK